MAVQMLLIWKSYCLYGGSTEISSAYAVPDYLEQHTLVRFLQKCLIAIIGGICRL